MLSLMVPRGTLGSNAGRRVANAVVLASQIQGVRVIDQTSCPSNFFPYLVSALTARHAPSSGTTVLLADAVAQD